MKMEQIASYVNDAYKNATGREDPLVATDLSNIIDAGNTFENLTREEYTDFVGGLLNAMGRTRFVNRKYNGGAPSLMMDSWEFGGLSRKISSKMPEVTTSENWRLVDGQSYDPNVFHAPEVTEKFYSKRTTFTIERSVIRKQFKQAFRSAEELNAFLSMLENEVDKALTVAFDNLIMATIGNMIAVNIHDAGTPTDIGNARAVNLLARYNELKGTELDADECLYDKDFLRYAASEIRKVSKRMRRMSTVYNKGGEDRFTPSEMQKLILHADFIEGANTYLQSDTFHDGYTALPAADTVSYWQGSGEEYDFDSTTKIHITDTEGDTVEQSGIIGVLFDKDACAVTNYDYTVRTQYNGKGDFVQFWHEQDAGYLNDFNENFVVFYVA